MTQPGQLDEGLVADLRRSFSDDQLVELTLKVMKFSNQKAKVALGTDLPVAPDAVGSLPWNPDGWFVPAD